MRASAADDKTPAQVACAGNEILVPVLEATGSPAEMFVVLC
jgi:hypothetical protein